MMDENTSDEELFMSDGLEETAETPAEIADPVVEAKPEEVARDTIEAPETVNAEPEKVEAKDEGQVPSWRVREINEAKREAEARAAEKEQMLLQTQAQLNALQEQIQRQQQPQTPPDIFEDPQGFTNYQQQQFASQTQSLARKIAELEAKTSYGSKEVDAALKAAIEAERTNPQVAVRIQNAPNPWVEAVNWHKEQQTQQAIGEGGIDGFRQRERDALMADPEFRRAVYEEMRGEAGSKPKSTIGHIPSLSKAPATSANTESPGAMSEQELWLTS